MTTEPELPIVDPPLNVIDITYMRVDSWNTLITVKDDYDIDHPELLDGASKQIPYVDRLEIGELARVVHFATMTIWSLHWKPLPVTVEAFPHAGRVGRVTARSKDGRLYTLAFPDGTRASYYHNELQETLSYD